MEVLYELGIVDEFLKRPHSKLHELRGCVAGETVTVADFSHVTTHCKLVSIAPFMHDRVSELEDWNDIKLLTVVVDRLRSWHRPGLLCIGDAAHAMSPIGGVGINLAIQDAVAAANALAGPLKRGQCSEEDLARIGFLVRC
jgi:2-polyprenyl-6-methoxyphenol hydroxylase-like FAD-dependent oxidoreductase